MRQPHEVFTPKTIVSREMFERRNRPDLDGNPGLQDTLREAIVETGCQLVVYGDTGVGKSSLVKYSAEDERAKTIEVQCMADDSYTDLFERAIRSLVDVKEISRTTRIGTSGSLEVGTGALSRFLVSIKGTLTRNRDLQKSFEVVEKSPLDALIDAMKESDVQILVLDNFQNMAEKLDRQLIAQSMEALADRSASTGDIKIIVVGIAENAATLIGRSGSYGRRITEIGVPRMDSDEISEILGRGFKLLGIDLPDQIRDRLVFFSDGFPFFAHLLGLHISRLSRRENRTVITEDDLLATLNRVSKEVEQSFRARVMKAFERGGNVQPRKKILHLLANSDQHEWMSNDVIGAWSEKYGKPSGSQFLHVALGQLIDEERGGILRRTGTRNMYIYRFSDPQMRPYLRLLGQTPGSYQE